MNEERINDTMAQGKRTDELELRSILQWSLEGLTNREIGQRLCKHTQSVARLKVQDKYNRLALYVSKKVSQISLDDMIDITKS